MPTFTWGQAQSNPAQGTASTAQASGQPAADFPDLTIPDNADVATLQSILAKAKQARPVTGENYKSQQNAIKTAAAKLVGLLKKDSREYQQAEVDVITSSVALLTFFSEKDQAELTKQLVDFLKNRKQLSMQDVQTGLTAAGMLELRPQKQPAHDVYSVLDELLKDDKRPEMQSMRINVQGSIRRLEMLGRKFEFQASSIAGQSLKAEDFAGKFLLVNFFASWSPPSVAELQLIKAQHEKYSGKGLTVVSVCVDEARPALDNILKQQPLPWAVVHDNAANPLDRLQLKYGIASLPVGFLVNKEGTVISLEARNEELVRLMQILFETPTPAEPNPAAGQPNKAPAEPKTTGAG